ncbi:hypothetical protein FNF27_00070 [Cafeteria roenbergensis]|nr:hypothetical protein FNF31_06306 [Cafeteria roenbergensis]KAA0178216.1 hypothetical protein FNF27_00070 [Cafeteria roenbergensis]
MASGSMWAVHAEPASDGSVGFSVRDVPVPTRTGPSDVLIRTEAAGVNRPDWLQARGLYPAPRGHSQTLGLEVAGTVVEAAGDWAVGDRVMALANGGAFAELVAVPSGQVMRLPALEPERAGSVAPLVEAAGGNADAATCEAVVASAIPEAGLTVWGNLVEAGGAGPGKICLIHGASGGVGGMAVAVARRLGCVVVAMASGEEKAEAALALGADLVLDYKRVDFKEVLRLPEVDRALVDLAAARAEDALRRVDGVPLSARSLEGHVPDPAASKRPLGCVDVVLDMLGGSAIQQSVDCCAYKGAVVSIGQQAGRKCELDMTKLMLRRVTLTGSTLRSKTNADKANLASEFARFAEQTRLVAACQLDGDDASLRAAVEGLEGVRVNALAGRVAPAPKIERVFAADRAGDAFAWLNSGAVTGKAVLLPPARRS